MLKSIGFLWVLSALTRAYADDLPAKIPGVDFSRPATALSPGPSPSPSPKLPSGVGRRGHGGNIAPTDKPKIGIGAAGNNNGYTAGQGKVKIGF